MYDVSTANITRKLSPFQPEIVYSGGNNHLPQDNNMSDENKELSEWITTSEAAEIMGVTQTTVSRLCNKGKLRHKKHGEGHRSIYEVWREDAENYELNYGGRPRKKRNDN